MDREEAIKILQEEIDGNLELTLREWQERDEQRLFPALRTAIEALSQPNYETDTEVRLAVTNRKKEKVILWDAYGEVEYYPIEALSTDAVQGVGRYENAMQKLRDMPRYLNGVKEKQITKVSANCTTKKPNDIVEQKNDVVDYISRADAMGSVQDHFNDDGFKGYDDGQKMLDRIKSLPSADRPSGEWVEKEVMVDEDANITEWQSAKCSVCGKYHTTPYMYYFDNFNHCPNCGAKMGSDTR